MRYFFSVAASTKYVVLPWSGVTSAETAGVRGKFSSGSFCPTQVWYVPSRSQDSHALPSWLLIGTSSGTPGRPICAPRGLSARDEALAEITSSVPSWDRRRAVVTFEIGCRTPLARK